MVSESGLRFAFTVLVVLVAAQRLWELDRSVRNEHALRARGAREHAAWQMPIMRVVHAAWLGAMLVEVWWLEPAVVPSVAMGAFTVLMLGQALRLSAMHALGDRWNVRILTLPGSRRVERGVFRFLSHPNYLGVALEIAALPLVGGAVWTALVFTAVNGVLLALRIHVESAALEADSFPRVTSGSRHSTRLSGRTS